MIREVTAEELGEGMKAGFMARLEAVKAGRGDEEWWLYKRVLPDGRVLYLWEMLGNNVRISLSRDEQDMGFHSNYCFHDMCEAWRSALGWDGEGEPEGWVRHVETGRRRPDGDEEREYVNP